MVQKQVAAESSTIHRTRRGLALGKGKDQGRAFVMLSRAARMARLRVRPKLQYDLGYRGHPREQAIRSRSGHPGPVGSQDPGPRAASRLGDQPAIEAGFWRGAPGQ